MRGKRPVGKTSTLLKWAARRPTEGEFWLLTDLMATETRLAKWEASALEDGEAFADEVLSYAQHDTDTREQMTQYRFVFVDAQGEEESSFCIRCRPLNTAEVEAASMDGALRMQMRHNEAMMRSVLAAFGQTQQAQNQIIELQSKRLELLEAQRTEALQIEKDAIAAAADLEAKDQEHVVALMREERWLRLMKLAAMHLGKDNPELAKIATSVLVEKPKLPAGE